MIHNIHCVWNDIQVYSQAVMARYGKIWRGLNLLKLDTDWRALALALALASGRLFVILFLFFGEGIQPRHSDGLNGDERHDILLPVSSAAHIVYISRTSLHIACITCVNPGRDSSPLARAHVQWKALCIIFCYAERLYLQVFSVRFSMIGCLHQKFSVQNVVQGSRTALWKYACQSRKKRHCRCNLWILSVHIDTR